MVTPPLFSLVNTRLVPSFSATETTVLLLLAFNPPNVPVIVRDVEVTGAVSNVGFGGVTFTVTVTSPDSFPWLSTALYFTRYTPGRFVLTSFVVASFTDTISAWTLFPRVASNLSSWSSTVTNVVKLTGVPYSTVFLAPWGTALIVGAWFVTTIDFHLVGLEYPNSFIFAIIEALSLSFVLSLITSFISIVTVVEYFPLVDVSVTTPYSGLVGIHGPSIVSRLNPNSLIISESLSDAFVFSRYL